jgi:putative phosphoribosyl transferase
VPVCSPYTCEALEREMEVWCVCVHSPDPFHAISLWYRDFEQTTDEEVQYLLANADVEAVAAVH